MLFTSLEFFAFILAVLALHACLQHRARNALLVAASYYFYGAWDYRFLALLFASTTVAYVSALGIERSEDPRKKRAFLALSLVFGLGTLGVFKYLDFFAGSLAGLLSGFGVKLGWFGLHLALPVGISFYTFQLIGYVLDVYRGQQKACRNTLDFWLFASFFPLMLAGPIERARHLLPQIEAPRKVTFEQYTRAAFLILFGLVKKTVIADGISPTVDAIFNDDAHHSGAELLLATYGYVLQMYCDFSGYTDVVRGVAALFGFEILENFRTPFYAKSPSEYWTRWHISLSSWVKDYVYLPLALHFMRKGDTKWNEYKPHLWSMALMGLWHGAAWTYILWGVYHGCMLVLWDAVKWPKKLKQYRKRVPGALWILVYFHVTLVSLLIFRANSVSQVGTFFRKIFTEFGSLTQLQLVRPSPPTMLAIVPFLLLDFMAYRRNESSAVLRSWPSPARALVYAALTILLVMGWSNAPAEFIYFQF